MAKSVTSTATQTKTARETTAMALRGHVYTMAAAFAGVIFGVLGSMGFVGNYLQSQFAAQNSALDKRLVSVAPASNYSACVAPTSGSGGGVAMAGGHAAHAADAAKPAHHEAPVAGGKGGDDNGGGKGSGGGNGGGHFVPRMVSGRISTTGPNSNNEINSTNNYSYSKTNNNNVNVSNNSSQSASSGSANVSGNTNGGSADSGDAMNHNDTSTMVHVSN